MLRLAILGLHYLKNQVRYNFTNELFIILSAGIFLALDLYIINDFLHDKLAGAAQPKLLLQISKFLSLVIQAGWFFYLGNVLAQILTHQPDSLRQLALRLGATRTQTRMFRYLQISLVMVVGIGIAIAMEIALFSVWSRSELIKLLATGVMLSSIWSILPRRSPQAAAQQTRWVGVVSWRLWQMISRNRACQLCLVVGWFTFAMAFAWPLIKSADSLAANLLAFAGGFFLAMAMALQVAEDLKQAWIDRQLGLSHPRYIGAWFGIGAALLLVPLAIGFIISLATGHWQLSLLTLCAGAIAPMLMPALVLQIDASRPWIQGIMVAVLGFVLLTFFQINPIGIIAVPILISVALQHCNGRYYRLGV